MVLVAVELVGGWAVAVAEGGSGGGGDDDNDDCEDDDEDGNGDNDNDDDDDEDDGDKDDGKDGDNSHYADGGDGDDGGGDSGGGGNSADGGGGGDSRTVGTMVTRMDDDLDENDNSIPGCRRTTRFQDAAEHQAKRPGATAGQKKNLGRGRQTHHQTSKGVTLVASSGTRGGER